MKRPFKRTWSAPWRLLASSGFISLASLLAAMAALGREVAPQRSAELFKLTNLWTVHLKFTPEQWQAMEPDDSGGGFFGRGAGGARGLGAFGAARLLAPSFLKQGDQDHDGRLSRAEFLALGEKWFAGWDKEKRGKLNSDQLRAGLSSTLGLAEAGGAGGRPPGRNLQGAEGQRNGLAASMGIEFKYVHADLEFAGRLLTNVAVRYKGNGTYMQSRGSLKRSLKIDLNKYVKGQELAGVSKLNLHNGVSDASWMNEVLSHRLFRDAGVPAPRTAYARVFVTVPGTFDHQYFGLYSLVEDLDKNFAQENFASRKGAIFKPVTPSLFADLGDDWKNYNQTYDPKTELTAEQRQRVIDFCRLATKADDAAFAARLGEFLDLDEFARFMAVTVWLSNMDSILGPGQNYYVFLHPRTRKFEFLPWDLDHSFGQFGMSGSQDMRENLSIHRPWRGDNRFLERVFKVPAFKQLYLAKMGEFSKTVFKPGRFHQQVDEIASSIRPAVREESTEKLARFDRVVAGEAVESAGFGGFSGRRGGGELPEPIKPFVTVRAQAVIDQLAGKSQGQTLEDFGFGGRRGRGGLGGAGPAYFLSRGFMTALDANNDAELTHDELILGFAKWFKAWNTDRSGSLTEEQIRTGLTQALSSLGVGPPGGGGFGLLDGPILRQR